MPNKPMFTIILNTKCNQRCVYCPPMGESYDNVIGNLSVSDANEYINIAIDYGIKEFRFSGGEPLLHPKFKKFISMMTKIKNNCGRVHINTNGVYLDRYTKYINKNNTSTLRISIDSLSKKKYKEITGTNLLEKVLFNINMYKSFGIKICINMVVMKHNINEVMDMISYCKKHEFDLKILDLEQHEYDEQMYWKNQYINVDTVHSLLIENGFSGKKILPEGEFGMEMVDYKIGNSTIRVKDSFVSSSYSKYCKNECDKFPCPEGIYSLMLKPNGKITWCKRNNNVLLNINENSTKYDLIDCLDNLKEVERIVHVEGSQSWEKSTNSMLPVNAMENINTPTEHHIIWNYFGDQKKHGRDT